MGKLHCSKPDRNRASAIDRTLTHTFIGTPLLKSALAANPRLVVCNHIGFAIEIFAADKHIF
jgi:hypothetical protein